MSNFLPDEIMENLYKNSAKSSASYGVQGVSQQAMGNFGSQQNDAGFILDNMLKGTWKSSQPYDLPRGLDTTQEYDTEELMNRQEEALPYGAIGRNVDWSPKYGETEFENWYKGIWSRLTAPNIYQDENGQYHEQRPGILETVGRGVLAGFETVFGAAMYVQDKVFQMSADIRSLDQLSKIAAGNTTDFYRYNDVFGSDIGFEANARWVQASFTGLFSPFGGDKYLKDYQGQILSGNKFITPDLVNRVRAANQVWTVHNMGTEIWDKTRYYEYMRRVMDGENPQDIYDEYSNFLANLGGYMVYDWFNFFTMGLSSFADASKIRYATKILKPLQGADDAVSLIGKGISEAVETGADLLTNESVIKGLDDAAGVFIKNAESIGSQSSKISANPLQLAQTSRKGRFVDIFWRVVDPITRLDNPDKALSILRHAAQLASPDKEVVKNAVLKLSQLSPELLKTLSSEGGSQVIHVLAKLADSKAGIFTAEGLTKFKIGNVDDVVKVVSKPLDTALEEIFPSIPKIEAAQRMVEKLKAAGKVVPPKIQKMASIEMSPVARQLYRVQDFLYNKAAINSINQVFTTVYIMGQPGVAARNMLNNVVTGIVDFNPMFLYDIFRNKWNMIEMKYMFGGSIPPEVMRTVGQGNTAYGQEAKTWAILKPFKWISDMTQKGEQVTAATIMWTQAKKMFRQAVKEGGELVPSAQALRDAGFSETQVKRYLELLQIHNGDFTEAGKILSKEIGLGFIDTFRDIEFLFKDNPRLIETIKQDEGLYDALQRILHGAKTQDEAKAQARDILKKWAANATAQHNTNYMTWIEETMMGNDEAMEIVEGLASITGDVRDNLLKSIDLNDNLNITVLKANVTNLIYNNVKAVMSNFVKQYMKITGDIEGGTRMLSALYESSAAERVILDKTRFGTSINQTTLTKFKEELNQKMADILNLKTDEARDAANAGIDSFRQFIIKNFPDVERYVDLSNLASVKEIKRALWENYYPKFTGDLYLAQLDKFIEVVNSLGKAIAFSGTPINKNPVFKKMMSEAMNLMRVLNVTKLEEGKAIINEMEDALAKNDVQGVAEAMIRSATAPKVRQRATQQPQQGTPKTRTRAATPSQPKQGTASQPVAQESVVTPSAAKNPIPVSEQAKVDKTVSGVVTETKPTVSKTTAPAKTTGAAQVTKQTAVPQPSASTPAAAAQHIDPKQEIRNRAKAAYDSAPETYPLSGYKYDELKVSLQQREIPISENASSVRYKAKFTAVKDPEEISMQSQELAIIQTEVGNQIYIEFDEKGVASFSKYTNERVRRKRNNDIYLDTSHSMVTKEGGAIHGSRYKIDQKMRGEEPYAVVTNKPEYKDYKNLFGRYKNRNPEQERVILSEDVTKEFSDYLVELANDGGTVYITDAVENYGLYRLMDERGIKYTVLHPRAEPSAYQSYLNRAKPIDSRDAEDLRSVIASLADNDYPGSSRNPDGYYYGQYTALTDIVASDPDISFDVREIAEDEMIRRREALGLVMDLEKLDEAGIPVNGIVGFNISKNFRQTGTSKLVGMALSPDEPIEKQLAVAAQVYRDPRIEHTRVIFIKYDAETNREMVVDEMHSSLNLPGRTKIPEDFMATATSKFESGEADRVYILHNHPAGNATLSKSDIMATESFSFAFGEKFSGSIVINHGEYSFVDTAWHMERGDVSFDTRLEDRISVYASKAPFRRPLSTEETGFDFLNDPDKIIQHPLLEPYISRNPDNLVTDIAEAYSKISNSKDTVTLIGTRSVLEGSKISTIITLPASMFRIDDAEEQFVKNADNLSSLVADAEGKGLSEIDSNVISRESANDNVAIAKNAYEIGRKKKFVDGIKHIAQMSGSDSMFIVTGSDIIAREDLTFARQLRQEGVLTDVLVVSDTLSLEFVENMEYDMISHSRKRYFWDISEVAFDEEERRVALASGRFFSSPVADETWDSVGRFEIDPFVYAGEKTDNLLINQRNRLSVELQDIDRRIAKYKGRTLQEEDASAQGVAYLEGFISKFDELPNDRRNDAIRDWLDAGDEYMSLADESNIVQKEQELYLLLERRKMLERQITNRTLSKKTKDGVTAGQIKKGLTQAEVMKLDIEAEMHMLENKIRILQNAENQLRQTLKKYANPEILSLGEVASIKSKYPANEVEARLDAARLAKKQRIMDSVIKDVDAGKVTKENINLEFAKRLGVSLEEAMSDVKYDKEFKLIREFYDRIDESIQDKIAHSRADMRQAKIRIDELKNTARRWSAKNREELVKIDIEIATANRDAWKNNVKSLKPEDFATPQEFFNARIEAEKQLDIARKEVIRRYQPNYVPDILSVSKKVNRFSDVVIAFGEASARNNKAVPYQVFGGVLNAIADGDNDKLVIAFISHMNLKEREMLSESKEVSQVAREAIKTLAEGIDSLTDGKIDAFVEKTPVLDEYGKQVLGKDGKPLFKVSHGQRIDTEIFQSMKKTSEKANKSLNEILSDIPPALRGTTIVKKSGGATKFGLHSFQLDREGMYEQLQAIELKRSLLNSIKWDSTKDLNLSAFMRNRKRVNAILKYVEKNGYPVEGTSFYTKEEVKKVLSMVRDNYQSKMKDAAGRSLRISDEEAMVYLQDVKKMLPSFLDWDKFGEGKIDQDYADKLFELIRHYHSYITTGIMPPNEKYAKEILRIEKSPAKLHDFLKYFNQKKSGWDIKQWDKENIYNANQQFANFINALKNNRVPSRFVTNAKQAQQIAAQAEEEILAGLDEYMRELVKIKNNGEFEDLIDSVTAALALKIGIVKKDAKNSLISSLSKDEIIAGRDSHKFLNKYWSIEDRYAPKKRAIVSGQNIPGKKAEKAFFFPREIRSAVEAWYRETAIEIYRIPVNMRSKSQREFLANNFTVEQLDKIEKEVVGNPEKYRLINVENERKTILSAIANRIKNEERDSISAYPAGSIEDIILNYINARLPEGTPRISDFKKMSSVALTGIFTEIMKEKGLPVSEWLRKDVVELIASGKKKEAVLRMQDIMDVNKILVGPVDEANPIAINLKGFTQIKRYRDIPINSAYVGREISYIRSQYGLKQKIVKFKGSIFENPFVHPKDNPNVILMKKFSGDAYTLVDTGIRASDNTEEAAAEKIMELYREYVIDRIAKNPEFAKEFEALRGKHLLTYGDTGNAKVLYDLLYSHPVTTKSVAAEVAEEAVPQAAKQAGEATSLGQMIEDANKKADEIVPQTEATDMQAMPASVEDAAESAQKAVDSVKALPNNTVSEPTGLANTLKSKTSTQATKVPGINSGNPNGVTINTNLRGVSSIWVEEGSKRNFSVVDFSSKKQSRAKFANETDFPLEEVKEEDNILARKVSTVALNRTSSFSATEKSGAYRISDFFLVRGSDVVFTSKANTETEINYLIQLSKAINSVLGEAVTPIYMWDESKNAWSKYDFDVLLFVPVDVKDIPVYSNVGISGNFDFERNVEFRDAVKEYLDKISYLNRNVQKQQGPQTAKQLALFSEADVQAENVGEEAQAAATQATSPAAVQEEVPATTQAATPSAVQEEVPATAQAATPAAVQDEAAMAQATTPAAVQDEAAMAAQTAEETTEQIAEEVAAETAAPQAEAQAGLPAETPQMAEEAAQKTDEIPQASAQPTTQVPAQEQAAFVEEESRNVPAKKVVRSLSLDEQHRAELLKKMFATEQTLIAAISEKLPEGREITKLTDLTANEVFTIINKIVVEAGGQPITKANFATLLRFPPVVGSAQPTSNQVATETYAGIKEVIEGFEKAVTEKWGSREAVNPLITDQQRAAMKKFEDDGNDRLMNFRIKVRQVAAHMRDFALLNYNDKRYLDQAGALVMPYHFWYSRSYKNWLQRLTLNPAIATSYLKFKKALAVENADEEEFLRGQVNMQSILPLEKPLFFNLESAFNPLNGITGVDFSDKQKIVGQPGTVEYEWTSLLNVAGKYGPSVWTPIQLATAAWLNNNDHNDAARRWAGRLIPQTAVVKAAAAKFFDTHVELDPVVRALDDGTAEGDPYEERRIGRVLNEFVTDGLITREQAFDAARTKSGEIWNSAATKATANRANVAFASFLLGTGFKARTDNDAEIDKMYRDYYNFWRNEDKYTPDEKRVFMDYLSNKYPFMDFVLLSTKSGPDKDKALAYSVLSRIAPGDKTTIAKTMGMQKDLFSAFIANGGDFSKMTDVDKDKFMASIVELSGILQIPSYATKQEWSTAVNTYNRVNPILKKYYGEDILDKIDTYEGLKDDDMKNAEVYLAAHPELEAALKYKDGLIASTPVLSEYYHGLSAFDAYYKAKFRSEVMYKIDPNFFVYQGTRDMIYDPAEKKEFENSVGWSKLYKQYSSLKKQWDAVIYNRKMDFSQRFAGQYNSTTLRQDTELLSIGQQALFDSFNKAQQAETAPQVGWNEIVNETNMSPKLQEAIANYVTQSVPLETQYNSQLIRLANYLGMTKDDILSIANAFFMQ